MQQPTSLAALPKDIFFVLKDVTYTPEVPKMKEPLTIKGKIDLFKIPFVGPIWVAAKVTYPKEFWEIIGAPSVAIVNIAIGGNFAITFKDGFDREGEYKLEVMAYAGPTFSFSEIGKVLVMLPPFPPIATVEATTFVVSGKAPPQEENFQNFQVKSYGKGTATPVSPPGTLELKSGDTCRVYLSMSHKGDALTGEFYASIGNVKTVIVTYFDKILAGRKSFSIPASADWKAFESYVDIPITSAISAGKYDLYAKIIGITGGDVISPTLNDVIVIAGGVAQGSITSVCISKSPEGSRIPLPTAVTADSNTFEVYVTAKNTSTVTYTAGIEIKVYDPDNILRKSLGVNYAGMSPNEELGWGNYNVCPVDKAGAWRIIVRFLTNDGIVLAETQAVMTATAVSAQYKGSITSKWINKSPEGNRIELPTTVTADSNSFEIGVQAKNTSTVVFTAGIEIKVYDPDSVLRFSPAVNYAGMSPGEELLWGTYNVCPVDKAGTWIIKIRFLERTTSAVLAETTTTMTATAVAPPPTEPGFSNMVLVSYEKSLKTGDICHVKVNFQYQGPAITKSLFAAIGNSGWAGFDPVLYASIGISIPASSTPQTCQAEVDIFITSAIAAGVYSIYAKLVDTISTPVDQNTITITEAAVPTEPQFSNLRITYYDQQVARGGTCLIQVAFDYLGPQVYGKVLHVAIGNNGFWGFDEILAAELTFDIWHYETKTTLYAVKGIPITSAISPGVYDLYAKIDSGVPTIESPHLQNVVTVT